MDDSSAGRALRAERARFWPVTLALLAVHVVAFGVVVPWVLARVTGDAALDARDEPRAWLVVGAIAVTLTTVDRARVALDLRRRRRERDELEAAWSERLREHGMWE